MAKTGNPLFSLWSPIPIPAFYMKDPGYKEAGVFTESVASLPDHLSRFSTLPCGKSGHSMLVFN